MSSLHTTVIGFGVYRSYYRTAKPRQTIHYPASVVRVLYVSRCGHLTESVMRSHYKLGVQS